MLYLRGRAYSQDLRERVFAAWDDGERVGEVAELLRVSVAYVLKARTRRRTMGETTVRAPPAAPSRAIRAYVAEQDDITIAELRTWLLATHQVAASDGLIWHTLKLLGLSLKKSRSGQAFAKLEALLRAKALRTVEALWNALGDIVACFSPAECANFLRHAGYF